MKKNMKKKGFTLIELIVVIAILGILAAIAIPRLGAYTEKAKKSAADATAASIARSAQVLMADKGGAPTSGDWDSFDATKLVEGIDTSIGYSIYLTSDNDVIATYSTGKYPANADITGLTAVKTTVPAGE